MDIRFDKVVPILRIFDIAKADEFYLGVLGFTVDWDHRFEPKLPLYRQGLARRPRPPPERAPLRQLLRARLRMMMRGVETFHRETQA